MQAETCEVRLGGAGAVGGLLRGLDAEVLLAGVVGDDPEGRMVRHLLDQAGIDGRVVQTDAQRPTTHKHRFLATVEQRQPRQILRVDHERTIPATDIEQSLAGAIENELANVSCDIDLGLCQGVCTPDWGRGCWGKRGAGPTPCWSIRGSAVTSGTRGATLVKPNRRETELVTDGRSVAGGCLEAGNWCGGTDSTP
jgi:bifunctional ADP-heptose synthase (sugar kinase/adenylyltransferase)